MMRLAEAVVPWILALGAALNAAAYAKGEEPLFLALAVFSGLLCLQARQP